MVRRTHLAVRFQDLVLWHDPVDYLHWAIDPRAYLTLLAASILQGDYAPRSPVIVRSAKSRGLTRPTATPVIEDEIVYRALIEAAAASLLRGTPEHAHFGRSQHVKGDNQQNTENPYETWFETFLRRQGALRTLADRGEYVVESDVANFFLYINHDRLLKAVTERSVLGADSVALLGHLLRAFIPSYEYSVPGPQSLVQGNHDASRLLAHVYVQALDDEFIEEGRTGRYSRWVDDLVVSVPDKIEALRTIARIQRALEPMGLAAHPTKTRFISKGEWELEHYPSFNEYLDRTDQRIEAGSHVREDVFLKRFKEFLKVPRTGYWGRVIRRFFTTAKGFESPVLLRYVRRLISEEPVSARWILNYLSVFPLTVSRVDMAFDAIEELGDIYQDVEILMVEYLLMAPNKNRRALRVRLSYHARRRISRLLRGKSRTAPYVAGLLALLLFKGGFASDMVFVRRWLERRLPNVDDFAKHTLVVLGARDGLAGVIRYFFRIHDPSVVTIHNALSAMETAAKQEYAATIDYARPIKRHRPERVTFRPRALPCLFYLGRSDHVRARYIQWLTKTLGSLTSVSSEFRDERAIALVRECMQLATTP